APAHARAQRTARARARRGARGASAGGPAGGRRRLRRRLARGGLPPDGDHARRCRGRQRLDRAGAGRLPHRAGRRDHAALRRELGAAPAVPLTAYWVGPALLRGARHHAADDLRLQALAAVQHTAPGLASYTVYYETPSAHGTSSAVPGVPAPFGELQVTSEAL